MRVLFIGDIVGPASVKKVEELLPSLQKKYNIDFTIANGENAAIHNGITPDIAQTLHFCGVDVITGGNHSFRQKASHNFFDESNYLIRPLNYSSVDSGNGYTTVNTDFGKVAVVNLVGKLYGDADENPFFTIEQLLPSLADCNYIFLDFHAEATSEKRAMGFFVDGKITALFGTHTHIQTADEQVLPKGTGYITDVGMVGGKNSVLGVCYEDAIKKFVSHQGAKFCQEEKDIVFQSVLFDTETKEILRINV